MSAEIKLKKEGPIEELPEQPSGQLEKNDRKMVAEILSRRKVIR